MLLKYTNVFLNVYLLRRAIFHAIPLQRLTYVQTVPVTLLQLCMLSDVLVPPHSMLLHVNLRSWDQ